MFERILTASWDERSRRGWTTLMCFALQALAVAVLLVLPLLKPQGLPLFRQLVAPVSLGSLGEPPAARMQASVGGAAASNPAAIVLRQPSRIPNTMPPPGDDAQLQGESGPYIPGPAIGTGGPGGVFSSLGTGARPIMPIAPVTVVRTVRVSHMSEGDLIRKVVPTYPPLARSAHIQGPVVLMAVISKEGMIENLRLLSGHPMLAPAAIEAVRQWRYRPYILNNEPVEVETQVTVNFSLGGN